MLGIGSYTDLHRPALVPVRFAMYQYASTFGGPVAACIDYSNELSPFYVLNTFGRHGGSRRLYGLPKIRRAVRLSAGVNTLVLLLKRALWYLSSMRPLLQKTQTTRRGAAGLGQRGYSNAPSMHTCFTQEGGNPGSKQKTPSVKPSCVRVCRGSGGAKLPHA